MHAHNRVVRRGARRTASGPTHRSAPTVDNGRSLFCGARLPRRAHAPRHSVGRDDLGAPPPLGAHLCVRPWGKATTPLYGHVGAAICRPQTSAVPLRTGGHRPPLQNHRSVGVGADVPIGPRGVVCALPPSVSFADSSPVKGELYFVGRGLPDAPHSKRNTTPKRRASEDTGPYNTTVTLA